MYCTTSLHVRAENVSAVDNEIKWKFSNGELNESRMWVRIAKYIDMYAASGGVGGGGV